MWLLVIQWNFSFVFMELILTLRFFMELSLTLRFMELNLNSQVQAYSTQDWQLPVTSGSTTTTSNYFNIWNPLQICW